MKDDVNGFIAGWFAGTYVYLGYRSTTAMLIDLLIKTGCGGLILSHPIDTVRVSFGRSSSIAVYSRPIIKTAVATKECLSTDVFGCT